MKILVIFLSIGGGEIGNRGNKIAFANETKIHTNIA